MTVADILVEVDMKYPNDVEEAHKWGWITEVEKLLLDECLATHELTDAEMQKGAAITAMESVRGDYKPLAQPPYHSLYVHYIAAQIALINVDTEEYENEQTMYNNALLTYKNWFNRTHRARIAGPKFLF